MVSVCRLEPAECDKRSEDCIATVRKGFFKNLTQLNRWNTDCRNIVAAAAKVQDPGSVCQPKGGAVEL